MLAWQSILPDLARSLYVHIKFVAQWLLRCAIFSCSFLIISTVTKYDDKRAERLIEDIKNIFAFICLLASWVLASAALYWCLACRSEQ